MERIVHSISEGLWSMAANTNGLCSQGVCVSWESVMMTWLFLCVPCQAILYLFWYQFCIFHKKVELLILIICFIELVVVQVFEHTVHGAAGAICKNISYSLSAEVSFRVP